MYAVYAAGEVWDPGDVEDVRTLAVYAGCEMLAGRPSPLIRCKRTQEDWVPMVDNLDPHAEELEAQKESRSSLAFFSTGGGDDDRGVTRTRSGRDSSEPPVIDELDTATGPWAAYQRFIRPPAWIADEEQSDCVPFYPRSDLANRVLEMFSLVVILVSVATFCLETLPQYRLDAYGKELESPPPAFWWIETICVVWFTIEYVVCLYVLRSLVHDRVRGVPLCAAWCLLVRRARLCSC